MQNTPKPAPRARRATTGRRVTGLRRRMIVMMRCVLPAFLRFSARFTAVCSMDLLNHLFTLACCLFPSFSPFSFTSSCSYRSGPIYFVQRMQWCSQKH
ncbi:hypothetical protein C8J57DRAFT_1383084 [Mycena rebaudengoi]|nr:hypothetical protein C8J57DRAFT_1383084 [Mycena rebaudengoi]